MTTNCIIFDIETAPDERIWSDPDFVEQIRDDLSAPSNYKDPVKIEAYIDEELDKRKANAALSWVHGRIRAIGWLMFRNLAMPVQAAASEDEAEVIGAFVDAIYSAEPQLIGGFNVREFDIPFLTMRAAVHRIGLPEWWPNRRTWDRIIDPVDIFGRSGRLRDYLHALDLPPKLGDGKDAPNMPIDTLYEYVRRDVMCEAMLIDRMRPHFPALRGEMAVR